MRLVTAQSVRRCCDAQSHKHHRARDRCGGQALRKQAVSEECPGGVDENVVSTCSLAESWLLYPKVTAPARTNRSKESAIAVVNAPLWNHSSVAWPPDIQRSSEPGQKAWSASVVDAGT